MFIVSPLGGALALSAAGWLTLTTKNETNDYSKYLDSKNQHKTLDIGIRKPNFKTINYSLIAAR